MLVSRLVKRHARRAAAITVTINQPGRVALLIPQTSRKQFNN